MAMLITSIANIKDCSSEDGFKLFCVEHELNPDNYTEPEEGVCVDKMDLYRYGASSAAKELATSVERFKVASGI